VLRACHLFRNVNRLLQVFSKPEIWLKERIIEFDILHYKIAIIKKSYEQKAIQEFPSSSMDPHDEKNGVKDRILNDLGNSIKLVRSTYSLCALLC
jgi:hypothetical protein